MTPLLPELARLSAERMLNGMAEGLVIAIFAWVVLRMVGRRDASTRFAVWFAALLAIAALPWMRSLTSNSGSSYPGESHSAITVPGSWAVNILLVWATIAGLALFRVAVGLWHLRKLRARSTAVDLTSLDPVSQSILQEFQATRPVTLAVSYELRVPTALGFFKPLVVLPAWAMRELSAEELNSILIHELAHLRRRDDWTNLAQKLLRALLFFHPAVWWVERQLSLEREMACDDVVLSHTSNPRAYAKCLIAVAEKSFLRRGMEMAQAAVSRVCQTSVRVSKILDGDRPGAVHVWKPAVGLVAMASLLAAMGLSHAPELVAFSDKGTSLTTASVTAPTVPVLAKFAKVPAADVPLRTKKMTTAVSPSGSALARNAAQPAKGTQAIQARLVGPPAENGALGLPDAGAQTVLVVMQTQQWDGSGAARWTISVWRLTVLKANQVPAGIRIPEKSI